MTGRTVRRVIRAMERTFPEQRLFLKSNDSTRFVRLGTGTQALMASGAALFVGWSILATALILMDGLGMGSVRDAAARERDLYEARLNELSAERDAGTAGAIAAQERFAAAMAEVSRMQTALLGSEERRRELQTGIEVVQENLRRTLAERDTARAAAADLRAGVTTASAAPGADFSAMVDMLAEALAVTAQQRDAAAQEVRRAEDRIATVELDRDLAAERTDEILTRLEDAVAVSLEPLDEMFEAAGLSSDVLLDELRSGYSGLGGPIETFSTKGAPDPMGERATGILTALEEMNLYRLAAETAPFAMPLNGSYRFTSGFGPRWGRMHKGADFAGASGTPILATADGTVVHAGWSGGYGKLVKIRHSFGLETRYAHLSKIRVKVGQKISRGDRIGDMGTTGRSTGTHLHYEVRSNGEAIDPMIYIKAAKDVF